MRFIDYDKTHYAIYKKLFEYTPPALRDDYMRGYADGLHRALYELECQDKFKFNDCVLLTEDELRRRISDVSGIGKNRTEKAVENILEGKYETD